MPRNTAKIAVLWDESYLWGLICYRTFTSLGIDFELVRAVEIGGGKLAEGFDVIFVPGGWARDKMAALGENGGEAIKEFVRRGGGYLGFCGGAGLALSHENGLGLAPFGRLPTSERLPSFSGKIVLKHAEPHHPLWSGVDTGAAFYAWWPGQFALPQKPGDVLVLASYGSPMPGSFVTDLPVGPGFDWSRWEKSYGINLNPERITGEPAVVELGYGKGKVILSYLHFETPEDAGGHKVLFNLIGYLTGKKPARSRDDLDATANVAGALTNATDARQKAGRGLGQAAAAAHDLDSKAGGFIHFGKENFLWFWRSSWLLQWRRGVKGIEYSTIYGMLAELARLAERYDGALEPDVAERILALKEVVVSFFIDARELLIAERFAMSHGPISPISSDDPDIRRLREKLFSSSQRCGGLYKEILDLTDVLLLPLLRRELAEQAKS